MVVETVNRVYDQALQEAAAVAFGKLVIENVLGDRPLGMKLEFASVRFAS